MDNDRDSVPAWIAREIVPHERAVRAWLTRRWRDLIDVEDVIQEAYCRIANLASVEHIDNPAAYFYRTAHSAATDILRRGRIINFTSMTQIEWSNVIDHEPLADRTIEAGQELERVSRVTSLLPDRFRQVIHLRRIEGLSRKETAQRLGISENEVKNCLVRGLKRIMKTLAEQDAQLSDGEQEAVERKAEVHGRHRLN